MKTSREQLCLNTFCRREVIAEAISATSDLWDSPRKKTGLLEVQETQLYDSGWGRLSPCWLHGSALRKANNEWMGKSCQWPQHIGVSRLGALLPPAVSLHGPGHKKQHKRRVDWSGIYHLLGLRKLLSSISPYCFSLKGLASFSLPAQRLHSAQNN